MFGFITKGLTSVVKLAAGVSGAADLAGAAGVGGHDSKDPGRLAANSRALADAQHGDAGAVAYLKGRSGRFGKVAHTWAGDRETPVGGWATRPTKDDAYNKWLAATGQAPAPTGAVPITSFPPPTFPGSSSGSSSVGQTIGGVIDSIFGGSSAPASSGLAIDGAKPASNQVPGWMWAAAAAGLVAVLVLASGDGRRNR